MLHNPPLKTVEELNAKVEQVTVEAWRCKTCGRAYIGNSFQAMFCCQMQQPCQWKVDGTSCERASNPSYIYCEQHRRASEEKRRSERLAGVRRVTYAEAETWDYYVDEDEAWDCTPTCLEEAIDIALHDVDDADKSGPFRFWRGKLVPVCLDADDIVERACDDHHDSVFERAKATAALREAVEDWNKRHKEVGSVETVPGVVFEFFRDDVIYGERGAIIGVREAKESTESAGR